MEAIYLSRGSTTRSILHCRNWISGRRNVKKEDKLFLTLLLIRSTAMQMKQNPLQILPNYGNCPQHKMLVWNFGTRVLMPCITYKSVPKECVVKFVSESGKRELFTRQFTPRERPRVTLRPSWVHTRSYTVVENLWTFSAFSGGLV